MIRNTIYFSPETIHAVDNEMKYESARRRV